MHQMALRRKGLRMFVLPLVVCLLWGCQPVKSPQGLLVNVIQVTGREIEVADLEGRSTLSERVQLEGIDVPLPAQTPWGKAAQAKLEQLIGKQPVRLESDVEPREQSGQRLAYAWGNRVLLNEALVEAGYAIVAPHPPNHKYDQRLSRAQDKARLLGLGIWNPENPMRTSPAEFRGQGKKF